MVEKVKLMLFIRDITMIEKYKKIILVLVILLVCDLIGICIILGAMVADNRNDVKEISAGNEVEEISADKGNVVEKTVSDNNKHPYNLTIKDSQLFSDSTTISTGIYHTVGLKSDGTVVATKYIGNYYYGECEVSEWKDIVAISAGCSHTVGLKSDGTVVAIGLTDAGQCEVSDWKDIKVLINK